MVGWYDRLTPNEETAPQGERLWTLTEVGQKIPLCRVEINNQKTKSITPDRKAIAHIIPDRTL